MYDFQTIHQELIIESLTANEKDLSFAVISFILCLYLQNCDQEDVDKLSKDFDFNLKKNASELQNLIFIKTMKQLQRWSFQCLKGREEVLQSDLGQKRKQKFWDNFIYFKQRIDMVNFVKIQTSFGDFENAAFNLETHLRNLKISKSQINNHEDVQKIGLLFSVLRIFTEFF